MTEKVTYKDGVVLVPFVVQGPSRSASVRAVYDLAQDLMDTGWADQAMAVGKLGELLEQPNHLAVELGS